MENKKKKKKGKIVGGIVSIFLFILCSVTWVVGWFAPINTMTPIFLMMSRPEIAQISKNLMIGNFGAYFTTPTILNLMQPAWDDDQLVYGMKALCSQAKEGQRVFYGDIYTEEEKKADKAKKDVSLYCLHADNMEKRPYVIMAAGGGFSSVCTPFESLPVCASFNEMGYTCFALTYRISGEFGLMQDPAMIVEDVSRAIEYITKHADELNVDPNNYLIGGFSAGAIVTSAWCDSTIGYKKYPSLPAPAAACLMYGLDKGMAENMEIPSFIRFCNNDQYFKEEDFLMYTSQLEEKGIAYDYKKVNCLHGFGLGLKTEAEGWTEQAETFWCNVR